MHRVNLDPEGQVGLHIEMSHILSHQRIPFFIVLTIFILTIFKTNAWKKGIQGFT